jgi:hypothetical protein
MELHHPKDLVPDVEPVERVDAEAVQKHRRRRHSLGFVIQ